MREDIGRRTVTILQENKVYLPNIIIQEGHVRYYPFETFACHVLGYLGRIAPSELKKYEKRGYPRDALIGKAGLEKVFESRLRGRDGLKTMRVDALGWPLEEHISYPPHPGQTIELTIDLDMQAALERAIEGKNGGIVAIDTSNGDILAMASYPNFDPNLFTRYIPTIEWKRLRDKKRTPLINRVIEGDYQPGSSFKIVTAYAALVSGLIVPEKSVFCDGSFTIGRRVAHCWKPGGHGKVALSKALGQSCNVYFYNIGAEINVQTLAGAAAGFGLGAPTGIVLPNERPGNIPDETWLHRRRKMLKRPWNRGDTVNASIGQGDIMVTPLQMARLIAAVSNGGKIYEPRLVSAIKDSDGNILESFSPRLVNDLRIEQEVLDALRDGLKKAVEEGTARRARIKGVTVFGKTGSAQNPGLKTHAWFVCVMETRNPSVAMAVLLEGAGAGGTQAAPVAREALKEIRRIIDSRKRESMWRDPANSVPSGKDKTKGNKMSAMGVTTKTSLAKSVLSSAPLPGMLGIAPVDVTTETTTTAPDAFIIGIDPDETVEYTTGDDALYMDY